MSTATVTHPSLVHLHEDYFAQIFPNPGYLFDGEVIHWITKESLDLFLTYYKLGASVVVDGDLEFMKQASIDELNGYREFVLPSWLSRLNYYSRENTEQWVCPRHFSAYLETFHYYAAGRSDLERLEEEEVGYLAVDDDSDDISVSDSVELDVCAIPRFTLPAFRISRPHIIHFPTHTTGVSELCIFPNFHLFLEIYFRTATNYEKQSFLRFYHAHQATYSVLSDSKFARTYVNDMEYDYMEVSEQGRKGVRDPHFPDGTYDPELHHRHLEIGGAFALVEFRERSRRGLLTDF